MHQNSDSFEVEWKQIRGMQKMLAKIYLDSFIISFAHDYLLSRATITRRNYFFF